MMAMRSALCGVLVAVLLGAASFQAVNAQGPARSVPAAFAQCAGCHAIEPAKNGAGPTLNRISGRKAATQPGFAYSAGLRGSRLTWNAATLDRYLANTQVTVPGTTMPPARLSPAERKAIVAYLGTLK
ncbi:cytochrome c family protein [Parafrankia sp. BMG5.11]|uniref:c-type cytochrome n=1 Tax=Parafrankia sp. BMG5.11 TaxID=222540 RepID=UPI00103EF0A3|nr:c-type cytochrome [Parafrankia sp. BMG5.11]